MFKSFCKILSISLLSGCLLLADVSYKASGLSLAMNQASAETFKTEAIKDTNLMATLTMTSVGLLASRMWSCKMTADMMLAVAGGSTFLAGEVVATLKLRKIMNDLEMEIQRNEKGDINKEQIEALVRLRKSYAGAKNIANIKKMLQQGAAAAFLAAAGAAYALDFSEKAAFATCKAALGTAGASCVGLAPAANTTVGLLLNLETRRWEPKASAMGIATEKANSAAEASSEKALDAQAKALTASYEATCAVPGGEWACPLVGRCTLAPTTVSAGCKAITPTLSKSSGFCPAPLSLPISQAGQRAPDYRYAMTPKNPILFFSLMVGDYLFPAARADLFSPLGILSSAAIGFLITTSSSLGPKIDSYLLAPMNRAIIWGVLAGIAFAASSATDNVIKKIESNIDRIDNILRSMNLLADGTPASQASGESKGSENLKAPVNGNLSLGEVKYDDIDLSSGSAGSLPCYTGSDGKNCKSFDEVSKNLPSFAALDAETQKQVEGILKKANGFNGTSKISAGSLKSMSELAGSTNALRSRLDNLKKEAARRLKSGGSKFNLGDQEKKFADSLESSVRDSLKKSNSTPENMLASIYGGNSGFGSPLKDAANEAVKPEQEKKAAVVGTLPDLQMADIGGADVHSIDPEKSSEGKEKAAEGLAVDEGAKKIDVDDYEINNDITRDAEPSLFDLISNRYRASAYPRLFKIKETIQ